MRIARFGASFAALDKRDGYMSGGRKQIYDLISEHLRPATNRYRAPHPNARDARHEISPVGASSSAMGALHLGNAQWLPDWTNSNLMSVCGVRLQPRRAPRNQELAGVTDAYSELLPEGNLEHVIVMRECSANHSELSRIEGIERQGSRSKPRASASGRRWSI
jgi:hypothetical protein